MPACLQCGLDADTPALQALARISAHLATGDLSRAMDEGLLDWTGCAACGARAGLTAEQIAACATARTARLQALAARTRYQARTARLARRDAGRAARRAEAARRPSALPPAAAAALARARAKAGQPA